MEKSIATLIREKENEFYSKWGKLPDTVYLSEAAAEDLKEELGQVFTHINGLKIVINSMVDGHVQVANEKAWMKQYGSWGKVTEAKDIVKTLHAFIDQMHDVMELKNHNFKDIKDIRIINRFVEAGPMYDPDEGEMGWIEDHYAIGWKYSVLEED